MGKVCPKDRVSKTAKRKGPRSSSNKFLKPGALAQLRYKKLSAAKSCTDLGKKRVAVLDANRTDNDDIEFHNKSTAETPKLLSPERFGSGLVLGPVDTFKQKKLQGTPKAPHAEHCQSESRLESLPMDLLVNILCHLHHDQLRAVFHVSQRIRKAVVQSRQFHFNYTTPDRSRQEMLRTMTPLPTEHWPFLSKGYGKDIRMPSPHTPKAPRHGPRPPSRIKYMDVRQITAVLFQESTFPSRCMMPSVIPRPLCKSIASNRILFSEDELCQAVAQNKLR